MLHNDFIIWSYYNKSISYAKKFVDCHYEAEDLVSDAFMKILLKNRSDNPPILGDDPAPYIKKTIRNLAIDLKRKEELKGKIDEFDIYSHGNENDMIDNLNEFLETCNPSIIKMVKTKLNGLSTKEAAELLNINESAYKTKWHRVKKILKENLKYID
jgi:RNA polymerase sigma factor (sigma-70 family)